MSSPTTYQPAYDNITETVTTVIVKCSDGTLLATVDTARRQRNEASNGTIEIEIYVKFEPVAESSTQNYTATNFTNDAATKLYTALADNTITIGEEEGSEGSEGSGFRLNIANIRRLAASL